MPWSIGVESTVVGEQGQPRHDRITAADRNRATQKVVRARQRGGLGMRSGRLKIIVVLQAHIARGDTSMSGRIKHSNIRWFITPSAADRRLRGRLRSAWSQLCLQPCCWCCGWPAEIALIRLLAPSTAYWSWLILRSPPAHAVSWHYHRCRLSNAVFFVQYQEVFFTGMLMPAIVVRCHDVSFFLHLFLLLFLLLIIISDENSVRLSVCLSVCPSVTRVHCDKTEERSVHIFTPYDR